ncbi:hypothetical protein DFJ73DRAFT_785742 [Zopfochytrium polystomum]|nr:hypothetical protein DFJ73DRAFT_785742 [Zopfochytrium polystomum]
MPLALKRVPAAQAPAALEAADAKSETRNKRLCPYDKANVGKSKSEISAQARRVRRARRVARGGAAEASESGSGSDVAGSGNDL